MEIKINKEIKDFNETMFFGLSVRQFIFAILACAAAVGIYFGCRPFFNTEVLSWLCMIGAVPFIIFGFVRYNGRKRANQINRRLAELEKLITAAYEDKVAGVPSMWHPLRVFLHGGFLTAPHTVSAPMR